MMEDIAANTLIEIQYADSKTGGKRVPIGIRIMEGDELLYTSAIYAPENKYDIPACMKEACKNAPSIISVREQLKSFEVPVTV